MPFGDGQGTVAERRVGGPDRLQRDRLREGLGCWRPKRRQKFAGQGLQEICRAVGIPPVLHVGSCVDNSRILTACAEMVREGGIGDSFDKLPVVGAAPEWMSEKAIAIGMYFVASGISVVIGQPLPVEGSQDVVDLLTKTLPSISAPRGVSSPIRSKPHT